VTRPSPSSSLTRSASRVASGVVPSGTAEVWFTAWSKKVTMVPSATTRIVAGGS
jgi:hypothetical protein